MLNHIVQHLPLDVTTMELFLVWSIDVHPIWGLLVDWAWIGSGGGGHMIPLHMVWLSRDPLYISFNLVWYRDVQWVCSCKPLAFNPMSMLRCADSRDTESFFFMNMHFLSDHFSPCWLRCSRGPLGMHDRHKVPRLGGYKNSYQFPERTFFGENICLSLSLITLFIYFISLPKVTYDLSFKVICDLRLWEDCYHHRAGQ
jgi:hypothetical protein